MKEIATECGLENSGGQGGQKRLAKVVLCKCTAGQSARLDGKLFGIRIEKIGGEWLRTWAFKIEEGRAANEKFNSEQISGTFGVTQGYRGCPYCGGGNIAQCECGKIFCYRADPQIRFLHLTCPWCCTASDYGSAETINFSGGGY